MTTYYSKEHEWLRVEGAEAVVGITAFAADKLGDVVFVDLPAIGKSVVRDGDLAVVESVKAASDVYAPVGCTVIAVNEVLTTAPETVNADAEGEGWFCRVTLTDAGELSGLMDRAAYDAFCANQ